MPLNDVVAQKIRKGLNRPAPVEDSIFAYVMGGVSVAPSSGITGIDYYTPTLVYGIEDVEALGITEDYDTDNVVLVHKHLDDHFFRAPGQPTWIYLMTQSTPQAVMVDRTQSNGVYDLLTQCKVLDQGRIKVIVCVLNPLAGYAPPHTHNIDQDVLDAIPVAQDLANTVYDEHGPVDIILEGRNFDKFANLAEDLRDNDCENVSVVIYQDLDIAAIDPLHHGYAAVGDYAGMAASKYWTALNPDVSIADSPAAVGLNLEGNIQDAGTGRFLNYGFANLPLSQWTLDDQGALYDKHYVACRIFPNTAGVYISQSFTCAADTSDMIFLELSRVYNKAARNIYSAYVPYINKKIKVRANGQLPGEVAKALEQVGNQVFIDMAAEGDISTGSTSINPTQVIVTSRVLIVMWEITPMGKLESIEGQLKFTITT